MYVCLCVFCCRVGRAHCLSPVSRSQKESERETQHSPPPGGPHRQHVHTPGRGGEALARHTPYWRTIKFIRIQYHNVCSSHVYLHNHCLSICLIMSVCLSQFTLTLFPQTDGSVFSLRNIKMEKKHHRRILQQLVALRVEAGRAADYLECRQCRCGAPCTLCHPPPPLVYLVRNMVLMTVRIC